MFGLDLKRFLNVSNVIIVSLVIVSLFLSLENHFLSLENDKLRLKNLHLESESEAAKAQLAKQNEALESLRLELKPKEVLKEVLRVDKVFIKDKSCESELKAYKELFNALGE